MHYEVDKTAIMNLKKILTSLSILAMQALAPIQSDAAGPRHNFEAIPGSYNHLITTIHRHSNGMIWVGTATGLCRFDGYSIVPARTEQSDSSTYLNDYVQKICEDSQGRLWIKAQSQFGIYDPSTHEINLNFKEIMESVGLQDALLTAIESDKDGSIWIAVADDGVYKVPGGTEKAIKTDFKLKEGHNVSNIVFNKYGLPVCVDESGALTWIDPHTLKATEHVEPIHPNGMNVKENYQVAVDKNNRYWVYSPRLIELYDGNEGMWISDRIPEKERHVNTKYIYQDNKGQLWIVRDNHGLERIETAGKEIHFVADDAPDDITYKNTLTYLLEDNSGTTFVGTYKKGLLTDNDCIRKFSLEELPDVNCMIAGSGNWVWVGTDSSGLWRWNTATGEKTPVRDPAEGEAPAAVTSLVMLGDNTLYVGAFSHGLRRVRDGKFENVITGTPLDTSYTWSLTSDGEGGLWIATLGAGVFHYNPATNEVKQYSESNSGLRSNYLTVSMKSKDGKTYFGHGGGIDYFDPADGMIHDIKDLNENFDTSQWKISQLFEDSRGLLWAATSQGLKVIDRTHNKISEVVTFDGKTNNYINGIIEDNGGSMWVSEGRILTNLTVSYADRTGDLDISARHYDDEDGLMDSDFNQRSFVKLPSGEILLGGLYGANRFIPAEIKYNSVAPRIIFTDLYISNRLVHPGDKKGKTVILKEALHDGGEIRLPHSVKDFTIYFTTDNYALPEKTTYLYKLEGYDEEWLTLPPGQHSVTYTNLSTGTYQLSVKGINSDGYESFAPGKITIKVFPPFWATIWAYIIYALLLALAVWGIVKIISRIEQKRFDRKIDDEKRRKQEEINQLKFNFFTNVSHDLRTPLTLIVSPLDEMIKETDDPRHKKRLKLLKDNATRLLTLVNQLLDFRKNEVAGLQFTPVESDVVSFSKKVCDSFAALSERKRVNFSFYSDRKEIMMAFDQDKLEKIFMNLLGNAFKFTPSYGRVDVSLEQIGEESPTLRIKVADSGPGIDDKDKEFIFDSFYQANDNSDSQVQMGSGIGLSLVREYVSLHHGTVRVTDNVETGSVFIIELPIEHIGSTPEGDTEERDEAEENTSGLDSYPENYDQAGPMLADMRPLALVVDDHPDMTEMLKFELEKDFNVITAADGNEALAKISEQRPSIIITDLMMPGMDGIELCRRLKSDPETVSIPLIILTAKHDLGVKIEGLTLGAEDYITKPFNLDVLRLRMKRLIELTNKGATRALIDPEPEYIKVTPLDEKLIENAMKYVSDNIASPQLSVEDLSDHLGMSRVRLYKKIKQITGKTPIEFIRIIRLKRAAQLLRESQMNVSEIAYKTGFNSPKVFSKYFKDEFGILPSAYQDREGTSTNFKV